MIESTVTVKGQTTVPAEVRQQVGATAGARLVWHVLPDGRILVRAKTRSVLDLAGMVKLAKPAHVRVDAMNAWR